MSNEHKRLLSARKFSGSSAQPEDEAWDAGGYCTLEVQCAILTAGSGGGSIALQHSATNEVGSFLDVTNATWLISSTGGHITVSNFLRYIRWVTTGTIGGSPVMQIDIIAKACG